MIQKCLFLLLALVFSNVVNAQYHVLNKGVAGNNSSDLLRRFDRDVISEKPNLVILMVGTNDMLNSQKLVSYGQFEENIRTIVNRLKEHNIDIVIMSPPQVDTGYVLKRHNRNLYQVDLNTKIDSAGRIINRVAKDFELHFIDLNALFKAYDSPNRAVSSLILNQANSGKEDGIHPTKVGYKLVSKTIYDYLSENKLLNNTKIICFGDSITYGSYMDGAGTSEGDTYLVVLKRLINHRD